MTKSLETEMKVKGTKSWRVLEENVKDNYYAMFDTAITAAEKHTLMLNST